MDRNVPVSNIEDKRMWDILYSQVGYIHGEGLQNRTESQVGKDQMGGESEKGERGERTDGSEMEGAEQNEKRRQGYPVAEQCHGLGPVNTQDSNAFHQVVNEHVRSKSISVGERKTSSTKQPTKGLWPWARTCRMWPRRGGPGMLCYPSLG